MRRAFRNVINAIAFAVSPSLVFLHAQPSQVPVATAFDKLHFRSIGPATMSGRISDVAVYEANPAIWYVAAAHGGVWKTTSNGSMFTPLFQNEGLMAIGDVAVSQTNPDLVWVGTGESNNRQSTSWGSGVYKSTDGGKTFALMGLPMSKHINRILIHPTNNEVVLVAATGPLFGAGGERGIYRTTNGGKAWIRVLSVDDETGANDLVMSFTDPNVMFASMYQRRRTTCCMNGGGPGSALYKSTDAGVTWTKVTGAGFPTGSLGRIAVDVFRGDPNIVYATVEGPTGAAGRGAVPADESAGAPAAGAARGGGRGAAAPQAGGITGVYRSDDGGATWKRQSGTNARPMYFSQLRIDPLNADRIYMGGVGLHLSLDAGKTFEPDAALVTHDDVHAIWINPKNTDHMIIGNDGGLATSYDFAHTWQFMPNLPVGLFYHVSYDMATPYKVCGGMQDNYDWCGPSASRMNRGIFNHDWYQIQGGDGFVAIPDLKDSRIVYTESQDGNMIRRNVVTGESKSIRPTPQNVTNATKGESYRFHWDTPLMLSPRDPGVLLAAANRVFRSSDRGDSWEAISPDLTSNEKRDSIATMGVMGANITISRNDGISAWPTIVALGESPKKAGILYAGTDDGTVQMTVDGGKSWANITTRLPGFPSGHAFVSKVAPSRFDANVAYVAVTNYRQNDYDPYLWLTTDNGATFKSIASGLRGEVVRTITEDTRNANVLYVGTETGIMLSLDRGTTWKKLKANFPDVRVDELTIHPRDNALLVATHGRAIWVLDHLEPIQEYAAAQKTEAALFSPGPVLQWKSKDDRNDEFWGHQFFTGENPPIEAVLQIHFSKPAAKPMLRISNATGQVMRELAIPDARNVAGIQTVCWDQRVEPIKAITPSAAATAAAAAGAGAAASAGAAAGTPAGGRGAGGGGGGGGGGGAAEGRGPIPGLPVQLPPIGYLAENPCAAPSGTGSLGGGGGGGSGFGGGAQTNAGPQLLPGTYTVALVVDGKVVNSKPLTITMDPEVPLVGAARAQYNAVVTDLHETQRAGTEVASKLSVLYGEITRLTPTMDSTSTPAATKTEFTAFRTAFDSVRVSFGVPVGLNVAAAFSGGGGAAAAQAAAAAQSNALGRVAAAKAAMLGVWETPSAAAMKQATEAKAALAAATIKANAILLKAKALSLKLAAENLRLTIH